MLNTESPLVSVLVPTHNRPETLRFALRSLLSQTISQIEILVVGDGCDAATAEVISDLADPRIKWYDLPKAPGFGYANRNVALKDARGKFMAYLAHDDYAFPDHLEQMLKCFENPAITLAYSRPIWVDDTGRLQPAIFNLHHAETQRQFLNRKRNLIPACCVVYRLDDHTRNLFWDDQLLKCGDWDLWARIIEESAERNRCESFVYHPLPTTAHFKANWRSAGGEGIPENHIWTYLSENQAFPETLMLKIDGGEEQLKELSRLVDKFGPPWVERMRSASLVALDAMAEYYSTHLNAGKVTQREMNDRLKRLRAELDKSKQRLRKKPSRKPLFQRLRDWWGR